MNKTYVVWGAVVVAIVLIGGGYWWYTQRGVVETSVQSGVSTSTDTGGAAIADYKDGTYSIDGQLVTLINGHAESAAAPGSASKIVTSYFGNEATGDLNGDGTPDVAFLLTQSTGGSGTFYYVVAAFKTAQGYVGTNAVLLGDRIAPQTTEIQNGQVIVNYADRKAGEPMTAKPSVGVSKYLSVSGTQLVETQVVGVGAHCGGFIRNAPQCAAGLHCVLTVGRPDTGGTCTAEVGATTN